MARRQGWFGWMPLWAALAAAVLIGAAARAAEDDSRALTPQERIARVKAAIEAYAPGLYGTTADVRVSGTLSRKDGKPLPADARVRLYTYAGYMTGAEATPLKDGAFAVRVRPGTVYVVATAEGMAPAFAGPFEAAPDHAPPAVELVLTSGYAAEVRLVGGGSRGPSSGQIGAHYVLDGRWFIPFTFPIGPDGVVELEHLADRDLAMDAWAEGYRNERCEHRFRPGESFTWRLGRATPATGWVVSAATGKPIEGAELRAIYGPLIDVWDVRSGILAATTDDHGRFALNWLRYDGLYDFIVTAPGHAPGFLTGVHWGQRDLKVALGPELYVRGRILGPLDSIMGPEGKPAVSYDQHHGGTVRDLSEQDEAPVEVRDGVGHFEIQGLWQGPLTIYAGYKDTSLRLTKPVDDLVIDLRGEAQGGRPGATRDVRLRLAPPPGEPTPTGSLWIACNSEPDSHKHGQSVEHEIVDGEVRLSSPAPAVLTLTSGAMLGFVPKEEMMGIRVTTGAEPLVVKVPVLPAGAVVGRLLDAEGQAVGHSSVIVLPTEKSWQASVPMPMRYESTDARGRFALPDVPLGAEFRLLASVDWSFVSKGPLGVDAAHPVAEVDIRLPAGVDLRGRLMGPEDQPVGDAEVTLSYDSGMGFSAGATSVLSGPDGWFSIKGVNPDMPGRYGLSIEPNRGYQPTEIDPLKWQGKPLMLRLKPGLSVEGVVLEEGTGYPVPGATVKAEPLGRSLGGSAYVSSEGPTDKQGRFRFSNLAPGRYNLRFFDGSVETVTFTAGQKEPVVAHVKLAPWSRLEPRKPEGTQ